MPFNENLRELREKKGWTQEKVAREVGLSPKTISFYETGFREPSRKTLIDLAKIFDVSVDRLIGEKDGLIRNGELTRDASKFLIQIGAFEEGEIITQEKYDKWLRFIRIQATAFRDLNKDRP